MILPKFDTIRDISTEHDANTVFIDFIKAFTRNDLLNVTNEYSRAIGSKDNPIKLVCGLIVMNSTDSMAAGLSCLIDDKIMDHYGFNDPSVDVLVRGLVAVEKLIDESYGVEGLHRNGDIASWGDLRTGGHFENWLIDFDVALEAANSYYFNDTD